MGGNHQKLREDDVGNSVRTLDPHNSGTREETVNGDLFVFQCTFNGENKIKAKISFHIYLNILRNIFLIDFQQNFLSGIFVKLSGQICIQFTNLQSISEKLL